MDYHISKVAHGYIISSYIPDSRSYCSERYAFSTLKEVQAFLPKLFEKQPEKK